MDRIKTLRAFAALVLIAGATAAYAQDPAAAPATPPQAPTEAKLAFDREVYSYQGGGRRDPFKPLIGKESLGPLFDDLTLKGIIYSPDPLRSLVLIQDGAKRIYRLKRGAIVGNSRVVEIRPLAVRFAVENFGMIRYEVLELRPGAGAASGMQTTPGPQQAVPTGQTVDGIDYSKLDPVTAKRMLDSLARERRAKNQPQSNNEPEARR